MLAQLDPTGVWESTANRSPEASFFHTPYWARILSKTFPGKYQIATKTFKRSDGTVAVLPMMGAGFELKGFFGSYLSNPLGVYGGFISESPISGEEFQKLVERLQWVRAKRVELFGNPFAEQPSSSCPSWETRQNFTQVIRLDNAASQSELTGRYTHLMRNHINRAMRRGYRVRLATLESEVERYHAIYEEAIKRYGNNATSLYPVELFLNIFREGPDRSPIWLVLDNERVVGGAICFIHNGIWTAWNAAFLSEEFPYGVAKFLHNELIMEAYRRGLRYYDFNPSGGHEGTVIFKEMFGAEKRHFVEMRWIGSNLYRQYRAMRSFPSRLSAGAQAPAA
ncbi:MAG: GNAT family N-acetyltransferase, partial [Elusimicrobia bacterium]|nr:GNAT family N-acetyltransferase [Elusimicrobiota bacterium]